jgi:uncharacterized protein (DUF58 family)
MRHKLEDYWHQWILQREPKAQFFVLNRRNLYTFPGVPGFIYLVLVLILWLIGTNYQNNLILALAYGLISVFVVAILHAYANLAGISLTILQGKSVHVEDTAEFTVQMCASNKRGGENIRCRFHFQKSILVELNCQQPITVNIPMLTKQRGWLLAGRLLVETYYPLGLIRCWTWLHFDQKILVYPKLIDGPMPSPSKTAVGEMDSGITAGGSDFDGLREYQLGDARKHIAWKAVAKGKGLFTKKYVDEISEELWLDFSQSNNPIEERLGILAYWVVKLSETNQSFGLQLNNLSIPPNKGNLHRHECLKALALFDGRL